MADDDFKVISRSEAIALGLIRYFTGQPCKNGHINYRSVLKWECYSCKYEREQRRIAKNPGRFAAVLAVKRERLRPARNARQRGRYAVDPAQWLRRNRQWVEQNPERAKQTGKAKTARHRARARGNGGSHTPEDVAEIFSAQKGRCAYCREKVGEDYHVDHIVALAKGGSNGRENLQITCGWCNRSKGSCDPVEFAQRLGMLI